MQDEDAEKSGGGPKDAPDVLTFKEFLESVPPGQTRTVTDYADRDRTAVSPSFTITAERLWLHCPSPECGGYRYFTPLHKQYVKFGMSLQNGFLGYVCSNCGKTHKRYSVQLTARAASTPATVVKYGEVPSFGEPVPNRLLRLLDEEGDKDLFLKGRQCENQGLGVGAFSYYRRVVENKKVTLIKEIRKVADIVNAPKETKDALDAAMTEHSFKGSLDKIKGAIPESLLINGHNPMALLHAALSDGLHDRDDKHCLELATSIRVVLSDLVKKVMEAQKENEELKKALAKLTVGPKGKHPAEDR